MTEIYFLLHLPTEKSSIVTKKTSVLTIGARMTLVEGRLTNMEQENEWWTEWKTNRSIVSLHPSLTALSLQKENDDINHSNEEIAGKSSS